MSGDRKEVGEAPLPESLKSDPLSRQFPAGWKDVWFRRLAERDPDGVWRYACPLCGGKFDHRDIHYLQGDHVWPYSLFGETTWVNYQLVCGACNAAKSNMLENEVRSLLGSGEFRQIVARFLRKQLEARKLADSAFVRQIVTACDSS